MAESKGFSKSDMERVGIFKEMSYITIQDRYKGGPGIQFNEGAGKGKQMLPGGSKTRTALQTGYFADKYGRIMDGEAYTDPIKIRRQHRLKEGQKNIGKPFMPSSGEKKMSGLGNHYGTLSGPISSFSPQNVSKKAYKEPGKNFYTNPGKKGTGYGYVPVTIGQHHKYQADEYDRSKEKTKKENEHHRQALKGGAFRLNMHPKNLFDENPFKSDKALPPAKAKPGKGPDVKPFKPSSPGKNPAGMKAGTFDPYPSHSVEPFKNKKDRPVHVVNKSGKIFMPSAGPKSAPINSILDQNVVKAISSQNYRTMTSVMSY